jgi:cytoskeletal protein RodZ
MLDENNTLNTETPEPQPEEKGNRTFLIVGGILGGLIFLTLALMALYFLVLAPRLASSQASQDATAEAQQLVLDQALTLTAEAEVPAPTVTPRPNPTSTLTRTMTTEAATSTSVVVTTTPQGSPEPSLPTATLNQAELSVQATQSAAAAATGTALATAGGGTPAAGATPLPTTGFFDDVGLPLLIVLTFALLAVIFITRRMRKTPSR